MERAHRLGALKILDAREPNSEWRHFWGIENENFVVFQCAINLKPRFLPDEMDFGGAKMHNKQYNT